MRKKNAKENYFFKDEENDDKYKKRIHKIDKMFDTNEGGFIKMNIYNMNEEKPVTISAAIKLMLPYFGIICLTWLLLLIGWYIIGLPIGPGVFPTV